jgi:hypothetical protein
MREVEYAPYLINGVILGGEYGDKRISAPPHIDMTWPFKGYPVDKGTGKPLPIRPPWWRRLLTRGKERKPDDWRAVEPERRSPQRIYS